MRIIERFIVHVDMDAFFASVEELDNPEYRGRPIVVGSDPKEGNGRGVVAACSYAARAYGIHSAMPISTAYKKCPDGVFVRPNMSRYAAVSSHIFFLLEKFSPEVEPISVDEAFLDITGSYKHFGTPVETCRKIKSLIKKETGLTASIGLAPNKMTAKIASDIKKPDGLVHVTPNNLLAFLHPLPAEKIWGIGAKSLTILHGLGIKTIGDLARTPGERLISIFGKNGEHVWELANGIDPREVETGGEIKSVSNEHTFETDTSDRETIMNALMFLSEKVSRRLRKADLLGRTVTLKIRFWDFSTCTRSVTLGTATNFAGDIYENSLRKAGEFDLREKAVRLVGVKVSNLSGTAHRDDLFAGLSDSEMRTERLHKALDRIKDRYGESAIGRRDA
jgi:DNA polymerase IV